MLDDELAERRRIEADFWRTSPHERPGSDSVYNLVNKAREAAIFLDVLELHRSIFEASNTIVELGAGQGWASCIVKRVFPEAYVAVTDLSADAVASLPRWEHVYGVKVDDVRACASEALDLPTGSVDLVFCFAAAHHFGTHRDTLRAVERVLTDGGWCLYLYEPSCPRYIHPLARRRVERKRPEVPEDVLVYDELQAIARDIGLECRLQFYPRVNDRGPFETLYYSVLRRARPLQRLLPCTVNYVFRKPARGGREDRS